MPDFNGTGPEGNGSQTGRGRGRCAAMGKQQQGQGACGSRGMQRSNQQNRQCPMCGTRKRRRGGRMN